MCVCVCGLPSKHTTTVRVFLEGRTKPSSHKTQNVTNRAWAGTNRAQAGTNPPGEVPLTQHLERFRHEPRARRGDVPGRLEPHGPARTHQHPCCQRPFVERRNGGIGKTFSMLHGIRSALGTLLRPTCHGDGQPEQRDGGGGHAVATTAADFGPSPIALTAET